jgi:choice-of-anchor A domain-containing protein
MHSDYMSSNLFDGMLPGAGGCAARSVFTAFPDRAFSYAALAMSSTDETQIPSQQSYPDYTYDPGVETPFVGTPYILVRGAMTIGGGCGTPELAPGEECDMGDYLNGQPAMPWETAANTCSFTCRTHWCGDGVVDTELGEECDNGQENGRSDDALGKIGSCTSSCKLTESTTPPPPPPPSEPPVALCQNVTVVAGDTCGASASIDQGSYDPDGDLVGCTQSPAGPYDIGQTTVTLTCTDQANHTTSCTSVVTVTDGLAPTLALNGSASEVLECSRGGTYSDPGASASDVCTGALPQSSITRTGSVNLSTPATYALTYVATDASGNQSSPATRTVTVRDTTAPQLQMNAGPSTLQCNGTPYVEPGATATDSCSGNLSGSVTISSNLDQTHAGQYAVTYSVKDAAGNTSTATRQLTVAGPCTSCVDVHLSDYNLFVLESYSQGADVQGKVAAGGNISMQNFSVGGSLPASDINNVLVAGGNLTLSNGSIWGNAFYGNSYSANQGVTSRRGTVAKGTPIDFAARFSQLRSMSSQLASVTANGTTTRESWGGIFLRGTNSSVNVFNVSASAFTGAALLSISVPSGSLVVVNIRGASATFQNFGYSLSGVDARNILYNFVDTTTINASSFGFQGTLLAPYARMTFNNGSWDGGIYAVSLTGTAEGHLKPLNDRSVCP